MLLFTIVIYKQTCAWPNRKHVCRRTKIYTMSKNLPLCTHRYGLFVSYVGTRYNGSQRLTPRDKLNPQETVQEALEWSLENFLPKKRCRLTAASRTDKGVHALMNCYTLPLMDFNLTTEKFKRLTNENLIRKNHEISVNECLLVPNTFHPRKSVIAREYIYRIAVSKNTRLNNLAKITQPAELIHLLPATELYRTLPLPGLDLDKAHEAIDLFKGDHDYSSFTFKPADPQDTVRNIEMHITRENPIAMGMVQGDTHFPFDLYQFHFKSTSFLHNQIRRIMGTIICHASYQTIKLSDIEHLLKRPASDSWSSHFIVAEPWGLYLSRLHFNEKLD